AGRRPSGRVRGWCPVRKRDPRSGRSRPRRPASGERGKQGHRRALQGHLGRGRRGHRVRHRRDRGRRRRRRGPDRRCRRPRQPLPPRRRRGRGRPRARAGVRRRGHRPRRRLGARRPRPRRVLVAATVAVLFAGIPLAGMAARIPWADVPTLLTSGAARDATLLSLRTGAVATVLCVVLGTPLAVMLSRGRGPLAGAARTVTVLPMVIPPVVAGLALLTTLGRTGVLGRHLSVLGIEIGFSTTAVVIAQTFVAMPFLVVSVEGALRSVDVRLERTA